MTLDEPGRFLDEILYHGESSDKQLRMDEVGKNAE